MSDLIKSFAFDLQRFAAQTFTGGKAEGEEGITLSSLFNSAGRIWQTTDAETLGNRTFFWEKQGDETAKAPVQLTPETDNAPGNKASGLTLIKGVYDDPTEVEGKKVYALKSIEAIDAANLKGNTAKFDALEGVTQIVNTNGKIDIDGDNLGAIQFSGTGAKAQNDDLDWEVGTVLELDGSGNIVDAKATTGEEITTANGTTATFVNGGGKATFAGNAFDTIETFAKDGKSELNVSDDADNIVLEIGNMVTKVADGETAAKVDLDGNTIEKIELNATSADVVFGGAANVGKDINIANGDVNVANITDDSMVLYKFDAAGGDIIDTTFTKAATDATIAVAKTGGASFVIANDVSSVDADITIGSTSYKFGDKGDNGGVFVVENDAAVGFLFRDVGDSITIQKGQAQPKLFDSNPTSSQSNELAMSISSKSGNESFENKANAVDLGLNIESNDNEYTITKTADGYSVEVGAGAKLTNNDGTEIVFSTSDSANKATATINFSEDGKQIQSIQTNANGEEESGSGVKGTTLNVSGLPKAVMAEGFSINGEEITADEEEGDLTYNQTTDENGDTTVETNAANVVDEKASYETAGLSKGQLITVLKDEDGKITGFDNVTGNASVKASAEDIVSFNGASLAIEAADNATEYIYSANGITGLKDGDVVKEAGASITFFTVEEGMSKGFTILGTNTKIEGDSSVGFTVNGTALTGITGLSGIAYGGFSAGSVAVNGKAVKVTGDEDDSVKVVGNDSGITMVGNLGGSAVDVEKADGATAVGADGDGKFTLTFRGGMSYEISGNGDEETILDVSNGAAVTGLDVGETVIGKLDGLVNVNGESFALNNGGASVALTKTEEGLEISTLQAGASITAPNATVKASGSGIYTFAGNQVLTISGASNGVTFMTNENGYVEDYTGDNVTMRGSFRTLAGLGVTEQATTFGGNGLFTVEEVDHETTKIEALSGAVEVTNAGGASQLVTDGEIALDNTAVDGRNVSVMGDNNVTFNLDDDGNITSIEGFDTTGTISGNISGLTIDGSLIEVTGDDDDSINYIRDASGNYSVTGVNGDGVELNAIGQAQIVQTNGDGDYTFFGDQDFTIKGEGLANELDAAVNYWVDGAKRIRAINDLEGNITGNFEEAITVNSSDITANTNGDVIQVLDDKEIVVYGDAATNPAPVSVSAIDKVSDKASIVATGNATVVGTDTEGVFRFDNGVTDAKYTVEGDAAVKFLMTDTLNTGLVVGVDSLVGTIVFNDDENGETFIVNPDVNDSIAVGSSDLVSLTTDANGKLATIAGVTDYITGVRDVTIVATEDVTVNGQYVGVDDADDAFNIIVDKDGKVTEITDVTGDATIDTRTVEKAIVTTDKQGEFRIVGDKVYTVNGDATVAMTLRDGDLKAIDNLEGKVIIDELDPTDQVTPTTADISVNGSAIAFDSNSTLAVTVATDGSSITAVDGLADLATIKGDLDVASIAVPGNGSDLDSAVNGSIVEITINNDPYTLKKDADGVTINGAREAVGLDEEGELIVGNAGTYTVNAHGQALEADTNDTIVGYDKGAYAEIFDADKVLIRGGNVYTDVIEYRLGLHKYNGAQAEPFNGGEQVGGSDYTRATSSTDDDPLDRNRTEEIFAAAEAGEYDLDRPLEVYADNYDTEVGAASRIDQDLDFSGTDFTKKVHLYRGDQNVTLNSFGGNEVLVENVSDTYTSGEKRITLGGGEASTDKVGNVGDVVIVDAAKAIDSRVSITGGADNDSVYVRNNIDVVFDMGGSLGGDDKLITYASSNARVSLENYDPINTKAGIQIEEAHLRDSVGGVASAVINDKILKFGDGMVSVTTNAGVAEIDFGDNSVIGGTLVYLYTPEGTRQGVGFTHSNGGSVDSSQLADDMILIGNKDGSKNSIESVQSAIWATVIGGVGNDTVLAGEGDFINAGDGNNLVSLENDSTRGGAEIVLDDGNTIIENTNNTFYADHGDTLDVDDPANISYDTVTSSLIVRGNGYNATVVAPDHDSIEGATSTDTIGVNIGSTYVNQLVKDADGKVWKMAVGGESAVIDVKDDEDIRADYYKAVNGAVTFENYDGFGPVQIDLSNDENSWGSKIDGVEVKLDGIVSVEAGESDTTIKGSENNEWFFAGKGKSSLYGAGGKNLLVGYKDASDDNITKEGSTTFFVLGQADTGVNTIESFAFVNDNNYTNNSIVADMIEIDTANNFVTANSVEISNQDIVFSVENRTTGVRESVLVKDAASSYEDEHVRDFRITDSVIAQVADDDLYFDKFANFYMATGKNATVKVSNDQDYSRVWLANPAIGSTFVGDIHVIDATEATVTAELAGNDYNNTILAGSGDTSLWGGNFGDDLLIGGDGTNTFYYQIGNGADTIQGAKEGDVIDLTGVTIADVEYGVALGISKIDETGVSIGFANGGTLRVEGTADVDYLVQGQKYHLNSDRTLFEKKS